MTEVLETYQTDDVLLILTKYTRKNQLKPMYVSTQYVVSMNGTNLYKDYNRYYAERVFNNAKKAHQIKD